MDKEYFFTKEKFEALKVELDNLKTNKRKEIAALLEHAKSLGDLSENAEYHEARSEQANIEDRISKLENMIKNAVIVKHKKGSTVEIGSTVSIKKKGTRTSKEYIIAGSEESDLANGKVSYDSPLGTALMGKKKGDDAVFKAPNGNEIVYRIESVN